MNIAIYQPRVSYFVGGGEVVPLQHAKFLSLLGHNLTIITTRANFIKPSEYFLKFLKENPKIKIEYLNLPDDLRWIYQEKPGLRWIRWDYESFYVGRLAFNYFLKKKFDIVAVHNYFDVMAIPSSQKSILHLHGYPDKANYIHEILSLIPDAFVSVSSLIKTKWRKLANLKNIIVATNGIDNNYFYPNNKIKIKYDLVYVGRIIKTKGIFYLIEALEKLNDLSLKVAIAGTGPELKNLKSLVKKKKFDHKIYFLDYVKDSDLPVLYQSSKIAVFPSYDREGILTTMLEAAACGKPVITTTACSMSEFLKNNHNGLLVKPQNSLDLARAIKQLHLNPKISERLGNNARKSIDLSWSWKKKIKQIEKIYAKVIDSN